MRWWQELLTPEIYPDSVVLLKALEEYQLGDARVWLSACRASSDHSSICWLRSSEVVRYEFNNLQVAEFFQVLLSLIPGSMPEGLSRLQVVKADVTALPTRVVQGQ